MTFSKSGWVRAVQGFRPSRDGFFVNANSFCRVLTCALSISPADVGEDSDGGSTGGKNFLFFFIFPSRSYFFSLDFLNAPPLIFRPWFLFGIRRNRLQFFFPLNPFENMLLLNAVPICPNRFSSNPPLDPPVSRRHLNWLNFGETSTMDRHRRRRLQPSSSASVAERFFFLYARVQPAPMPL